MRGTPLVLLVITLPVLPQTTGLIPSPASEQPPWMEVFRKIYSPQGQAVPLGSMDQEVENAWATALATGPLNSFFEPAAQQASQYFGSQGYDRKAEVILRQAISAAGQTDAAKARSLRLTLAQRFTQEQRFLAAASLLQEVIEEVKATPDPASLNTRLSALTQLAQLREQMGEITDAEALFREAKILQFTPIPEPTPSSKGQFVRASRPGLAMFLLGNFSRYTGPSDLIGFYQRNGEIAKAEALLKKEVEEAKEPLENYRALQNYIDFLRSQQRWDESVTQLKKLIAMQSASSRPEDRQMLVGSRQSLAQTLVMTGKEDEALEILRENVTLSSQDAFQHIEALRSYAQMLVQRRQLDEAEKIVEQIRQPTGENAAEAAKYTQSMGDQLLSTIREIQNRAEEARALRERMVTQAPTPGGSQTVWNLLQPVQEAMARHKYDEAMEQAQRLLADSGPRIRNHPEEIGAFTNLIQQLPQGRQEDRNLLMHTIVSVLDSVTPADHPRVAQAIGQLLSSAMHSGFSTTEVTRLLERQEKILIAAKGADHPALNEVSHKRAQFFSFRGDYVEAASEMKRAVKRSESATGPKSQPTLQMMRELINSLQMTTESWPEEEAVRLALIERTGPSNGTVVHDMSGLAHRYFAMGQRENAVSWIDRAIELTRKNPQAAPFLQQLEQQRSYFTNTQNQSRPNVNPFYGGAAGRWFDSTGFPSTHGTRIGIQPVRVNPPPK